MNIHKVAALLFVLMAGTLAYAVTSLSIPSNFNIVASPLNISSNLASLEFGNIIQGEFKSMPFTITNSGGTPATLQCTIQDPTLTDGVELTLSACTGEVVSANGGTLVVTATLTASTTATTGPGTITVEISAA